MLLRLLVGGCKVLAEGILPRFKIVQANSRFAGASFIFFLVQVDDDQPTTKKLKITAVPFSKGTQFGVDDVHELASIVADNNNSGEVVRLPKARAMFASRACRSSIMIGKALDRGQMSRVVSKMATIEQPWNCPHGRPTMRHLADVSKSLQAAAGLDALLEA